MKTLTKQTRPLRRDTTITLFNRYLRNLGAYHYFKSESGNYPVSNYSPEKYLFHSFVFNNSTTLNPRHWLEIHEDWLLLLNSYKELTNESSKTS